MIAGPLVGTLLGDFGADVVKIESPAGDQMRNWGSARHADHTLWWSVLGRNKRSVALDLRDREAAAIAAELCARADVVVENFRPGTMERWGLGPEDVHAQNPRCVYARISGFGQRSRYRDRPGFASGGEAMSGLRYINGYPGILRRARGSRSATRWPRGRRSRASSWPSTRATCAGAGGQVVDAAILDACFAMTESLVSDYAKAGRGARAERLATAADRAVERVPLRRRPLGRDRGQPRFAVAAPGRGDGAAGARRRSSLRDARRARRAPGRARRDGRGVGGRRTPRTSSTGCSPTPASSVRRSTRQRTSSRILTSANASS